jgi:hypothetical protein
MSEKLKTPFIKQVVIDNLPEGIDPAFHEVQIPIPLIDLPQAVHEGIYPFNPTMVIAKHLLAQHPLLADGWILQDDFPTRQLEGVYTNQKGDIYAQHEARNWYTGDFKLLNLLVTSTGGYRFSINDIKPLPELFC